jgi:hypothetical protein
MSLAHRSAFSVLAVALSLTAVGSATAADQQPDTGVVLTPAQQCAVRSALQSGDPRRARIAQEVLGGEAGTLALADPWILHHHRLDTSRSCSGR